jgi:zinc protease
VNEIRETRLDNGLLVLTREMHAAPVVSSWLWYRVGSRNERTGITGISHWVEHMMFKGTPRFGKGDLHRMVSRNGGSHNAMTYRDFTCYYETLPADRIDLALEMEADRMVNALFDEQEVQSERTVIISEREGSENYPQFHLYEELLAAAFKVHTYGHETIGWKCDLQTITRDDLYTHYRTFYVPNNATLIVVGDFKTAPMLEKINKLFGGIPAGPAMPAVTVAEPPQEGERRLVVRRPGGGSYFAVAFHAPSASHPDYWPMFVLAGVLSGVGSLNFTSPGASGKSARLYPALVEKGLAADANVSFGLSVDPDLLGVSATALQGVSLKRIEAVVFAELDKLAQEPPTAEELATVRKQVRTQIVYSEDGVANLGFTLGEFEVASSYKDYLAIMERVSSVTGADVQRVAATYLNDLNRTVGWFIPTNSPTKGPTNGEGGENE